jgi:hypothetical protein
VARAKSTTPEGHGELLVEPAFADWAGLARTGAATAASWDFELAGRGVAELRAAARAEALGRAREFSSRLGVPVADVADSPALLVATGHQPELYHPGVWVKDFLLQRLAEETGAAALDLVVDSDGFESVGIHSPCLRPDVRVCRAYLAVGVQDGCYACAPVPSPHDLREFRQAGEEQLATLPAPSIPRHFARFCDVLDDASVDAKNLAELVTFARRRYEAPAGTDYLELPVTSLSRSEAFAAFVAHLAFDARAFADAYNASLAAYRERTGTRSAAQPFPDLATDGDAIELPLWTLGAGRRTVWVRAEGEARTLVAGDDVLCDLGEEAAGATRRLLDSGVALAPKALGLTLFTRLLVADLFIHGVGGGRYDQVTDDVARRYFGVELPAFTVASLTVYLPLGAHVVGDDEIDAVEMALNRLTHNPDQALAEVEFDSTEEAERAETLANEKRELVAAIAAPGADKKSLGLRIREVNAELAGILTPVREDLAARLKHLHQLRDAREILTDRTYPFCFWDPAEIADKAR